MSKKNKSDCFLLTISQNLERFNSDYIQTKLCDNLRHGYLLSYLKKEDFKVKRYNSFYQNFSVNELKSAIKQQKPKVVVFSVNYLGLSDNFEESLKVIKKLKKDIPDIHISLEGTFSTLNYQSILKKHKEFVDSVVVGEAELIIPQLIKLPLQKVSGVAFYSEKKDKIIRNKNKNLIKDLNKLPFPDRTNLNKVLEKGGVAQIRTSRGCNAGCNFCYLNDYYNECGFSSRRERSAESVVEELESLIEKNECEEIWFADEDIIGSNLNSKKRIRKIASSLIKSNYSIKLVGQISAKNVDRKSLRLLKEAGLRRVFMGIESGSQEFLNKIGKGLDLEKTIKSLEILSEVGIFCELGFIMFHSESTKDKIKKDIDFLEKYCVNNKESYLQIYNLNRLTPKPKKEEELGYGKNKEDLLSEDIKIIYNATSLFSLKTRKICNYLRNLQLNKNKDPLTLRVTNNYNIHLINLLRELVACEKLDNKQAFNIAERNYKELANELKEIATLEISNFSS